MCFSFECSEVLYGIVESLGSMGIHCDATNATNIHHAVNAINALPSFQSQFSCSEDSTGVASCGVVHLHMLLQL